MSLGTDYFGSQAGVSIKGVEFPDTNVEPSLMVSHTRSASSSDYFERSGSARQLSPY